MSRENSAFRHAIQSGRLHAAQQANSQAGREVERPAAEDFRPLSRRMTAAATKGISTDTQPEIPLCRWSTTSSAPRNGDKPGMADDDAGASPKPPASARR